MLNRSHIAIASQFESLNSFSIKELIEGLRNGDMGAAALFYDRFGKKINRVVWRLLGADLEHDDVVQQVFVNILSSIHKLRDLEAFDDWIFGVAINTVRKEIRSRKFRRILISVPDFQETEAAKIDPDKQILTKKVFSILDTMKAEDRIIFVLRFVEENTVDEIATRCKYSPSTAKRRIARAKKEFLERVRKDATLTSFAKRVGNMEISRRFQNS